MLLRKDRGYMQSQLICHRKRSKYTLRLLPHLFGVYIEALLANEVVDGCPNHLSLIVLQKSVILHPSPPMRDWLLVIAASS